MLWLALYYKPVDVYQRMQEKLLLELMFKSGIFMIL